MMIAAMPNGIIPAKNGAWYPYNSTNKLATMPASIAIRPFPNVAVENVEERILCGYPSG